jgi:radical SAM superfamily enzyme YgiQ (UPF0313 family)
MNILMVYPEFPDTFWSFKHALRFVNKRASSPPLGLATVAAMLPKVWNKRLIDMNVTKLHTQDLEWADYVFVSAMIIQRSSAIDVIAKARQAGKKVVAGGPLFTAEAENFAQVDYLVLNEAEITLPQFLNDLAQGCPQHIYQTADYPDITQTPVPLWELVDRRQYDSMSIQFSRGCPFNCDFCNVTALLGHRPRTKTAEQIIAELDKMYSLGWRRNVFFVDDNFIGNKRILKESVLPALIEWRKGKTGCQFITEASINLADDTELMELMAQAGFISVFVGIETPSEDSLNECHKVQNKNRDLVESVKRLQHHGLQVMGGFIVGFDSDTPSIFQRQIDFIQNSGIVTAMVGLLQAPYGTELYRRMESEGRVIHGMSGDNADGKTNIVTKMDASILQNGYHHILQEIYSPHQFYKRVQTFLQEYRPAQAMVKVEPQEILAFFRSIYWLGIRNKDRHEYWRMFFWALFKQPSKFPLAITFTIYWFHFWRVFTHHILPNQIHTEAAAD